jgi:hypothetical protein
MDPKTIYEKKRTKALIIESNSEEKEVKPKKKKIIIEKTTPISVEKPVTHVNKPSRKARIRGDPKNVSKRRKDIKKRRVVVVDSSSTEKL